MGKHRKVIPKQPRNTTRSKNETRLEFELNMTESDPVKPTTTSTRSSSGATLPASNANTIAKLNRDMAAIYEQNLRKVMDNDTHALVIDTQQFKELLLDHIGAVKRAAARIKNSELRDEFLSVGTGVSLDGPAKKLREEFELVLQSKLNTAKVLDFKKLIKGDLSIYIIWRKRAAANETTFDSISNLMTRVRKELVSNSARGTTKRITGILIGGLDVDFDTISKKGIGNTAKKKQADRAPVDKDTGEVKLGTGAQLGHFRGPGTREAALYRDLVKKYANNISELTALYAGATIYHDVIHSYDAETTLNDVVYDATKTELKGDANFTISIIGLELSAANALSGSYIRQHLENMRRWVRNNAEILLTMRNSKSIINSIMDDLVVSFINDTKKRRFKAKNQGSYNSRLKVKGTRATLNSKIKNKKLDEENIKGNDPQDLNELINFLNSRLHDKIRENMGKGRSKKTLNYRTGRFAKSAEIKHFFPIHEKNAVGASVKYMRYPYGVFEEGGRLNPPIGRDPKRIFGKSIRQLLQEQKIANLRRVKVELRG
jgi:hypothetical protein